MLKPQSVIEESASNARNQIKNTSITFLNIAHLIYQGSLADPAHNRRLDANNLENITLLPAIHEKIYPLH